MLWFSCLSKIIFNNTTDRTITGDDSGGNLQPNLYVQQGRSIVRQEFCFDVKKGYCITWWITLCINDTSYRNTGERCQRRSNSDKSRSSSNSSSLAGAVLIVVKVLLSLTHKSQVKLNWWFKSTWVESWVYSDFLTQLLLHDSGKLALWIQSTIRKGFEFKTSTLLPSNASIYECVETQNTYKTTCITWSLIDQATVTLITHYIRRLRILL